MPGSSTQFLNNLSVLAFNYHFMKEEVFSVISSKQKVTKPFTELEADLEAGSQKIQKYLNLLYGKELVSSQVNNSWRALYDLMKRGLQLSAQEEKQYPLFIKRLKDSKFWISLAAVAIWGLVIVGVILSGAMSAENMLTFQIVEYSLIGIFILILLPILGIFGKLMLIWHRERQLEKEENQILTGFIELFKPAEMELPRDANLGSWIKTVSIPSQTACSWKKALELMEVENTSFTLQTTTRLINSIKQEAESKPTSSFETAFSAEKDVIAVFEELIQGVKQVTNSNFKSLLLYKMAIDSAFYHLSQSYKMTHETPERYMCFREIYNTAQEIINGQILQITCKSSRSESIDHNFSTSTNFGNASNANSLSATATLAVDTLPTETSENPNNLKQNS